jgi:hypothetical protein
VQRAVVNSQADMELRAARAISTGAQRIAIDSQLWADYDDNDEEVGSI